MTFKLRAGVTFQDGEPFNADAVCFNFDRWYNFTGPMQAQRRRTTGRSSSAASPRTRRGTRPSETSLFASCEAADDDTVMLNFTRPRHPSSVR